MRFWIHARAIVRIAQLLQGADVTFRDRRPAAFRSNCTTCKGHYYYYGIVCTVRAICVVDNINMKRQSANARACTAIRSRSH